MTRRRPSRNEKNRGKASSPTRSAGEDKQHDAAVAVARRDDGEEEKVDAVVVGPDVNMSKGPLDRKLYRQILLPNGLRCLLIEDVNAYPPDGMVHTAMEEDDDESDSDDSSDDDEDNADDEDRVKRRGRRRKGGPAGSDDDKNSDDEEDDDASIWSEEEGLRNAAANLLVGVGSAYDPPQLHGLAHFLEHLLFMGSDKYPGENDYSNYVSKHGGTENAYTDWESTSFSLEIPQEKLWPALDRLAQFFIKPLMNPGSVDRELRAIESEFQLHKNSDHDRWQQLLCATATDKGHWMSKFSWGNRRSLETIPKELLGVDPMEHLWKFYNRHYYAANMRLVLVGAYPLDVMEGRVSKIFKDVPAWPRGSVGRGDGDDDYPLPYDDKEAALRSWDVRYRSPLVEAGNPMEQRGGECSGERCCLGKIFRIVPVKDRHTLMLTWPIPPQFDNWRSKPCEYVSHLLGHEAAGSLLSYLIKRSWATSCEVGCGEEGSERSSSHALLTATFVLSELGMQHWREVIEATYQYIGMLRYHSVQGWPDWIYEELRRTVELCYLYCDEAPPDDLCEDLVESMAPHANLPPERILDGNALMFEFDADAVKHLLDGFLTPSNARIDISSSTFGRPSDFPDLVAAKEGIEMLVRDLEVGTEPMDSKFDTIAASGPPQVEPMFGTLFWCTAVPQQWLDEWCKLSDPQQPTLPLQLPPQNPYVPMDLALKQLPDDDAPHPLLHSCLKMCISVGRKKQWFPATVMQYNRKTDALLLSYEDENMQWHRLDNDDLTKHDNGIQGKQKHYLVLHHHHDRHHVDVRPGYEGTFDGKTIKFRVLATGGPGRGPVIRFGDRSDWDVEDATTFPPIPPAMSAGRLPREISSSNLLKMWWLQDRHFHRPIVDLRLQVLCRNANSTPLHRACAELLSEMCVDALTEPAYLASVCDLSYSLSATDVGFVICLEGFNDKQLEFFQSVMVVFLSFALNEDKLPSTIRLERFDACLEVLRRKYKNAGLSADKLCTTLRIQAMRPTSWSANEKMQALDSIDIAKFACVASSLYDGYAIEALYHGNVDRTDAETMKDVILNLVGHVGKPGLPRKKYPPQSVLRIPGSLSAAGAPRIVVPSKDPAEPNTAVEIYFQIGKDSLRERVLIDLLVQMMDEPLFDKVRTKDQFGYDVSCDTRWTYGIMGMVFRVITNVKSADEVVDRVEKFLAEFREEFENFTNEDYMGHLVGLANEKLDMFNSLKEETNCYWGEIRDGGFQWESWRDEAVILRSIRKEDALEAFDKWLNPSSGRNRNLLVVQVIGNGEGGASRGRPLVRIPLLNQEQDLMPVVDHFFDEQVRDFRKTCKNQTWGRVNSKLF